MYATFKELLDTKLISFISAFDNHKIRFISAIGAFMTIAIFIMAPMLLVSGAQSDVFLMKYSSFLIFGLIVTTFLIFVSSIFKPVNFVLLFMIPINYFVGMFILEIVYYVITI